MAAPGEVHPADDPGGNFVGVGVRIGDQRVLAAEFERHLLERIGRRPHDRFPGRHRADKPDFRDQRMRRQCGAALASARKHGEYAGRKERSDKLRESQRGKRRLLGRLDDESVAGGERRPGAHRGEQQWMVERVDARDHAQRLAQRVVQHAGAHRDRAASDFADQAGEVFHAGGADSRVVYHLGDRIAAVGGVDEREFASVPEEQRRDLAQDLCCMGCAHRAIDVLRSGPRDFAQRLPRRGAPNVGPSALGSGVPAARVVKLARN